MGNPIRGAESRSGRAHRLGGFAPALAPTQVADGVRALGPQHEHLPPRPFAAPARAANRINF